MSNIMPKWVLCYMQPAFLQTSLRIHEVWSGATLPAIKLRKETPVTLADSLAPDRSVLMRRLVLGSACRIWH